MSAIFHHHSQKLHYIIKTFKNISSLDILCLFCLFIRLKKLVKLSKLTHISQLKLQWADYRLLWYELV